MERRNGTNGREEDLPGTKHEGENGARRESRLKCGKGLDGGDAEHFRVGTLDFGGLVDHTSFESSSDETNETKRQPRQDSERIPRSSGVQILGRLQICQSRHRSSIKLRHQEELRMKT